MKKLFTTLALLATLTTVSAQTTIPQGGTGWSTSTPGDLLVGTSSIRYSRLPIGSSGTVLQASSTSPFRMAWASITDLFSSLLSSNNTWTGTNTFNATTTLNKVVAGSSAGIQFFSNALTQIADFGAGGGSNASFLGGVNITGNLAVDTNTLYVDSTNNRVGIGTTTPNSLLTLASASSPSLSIRETGNTLYTIVASTNLVTRINGSDRLTLSSGGALTVNSSSLYVPSGNVGIGTSSPQFDLTLEGSTNVDFMMRDNAQGTNLKSYLFRNTGGNLAIGRVSDNAGTLTTYMTFLNGGNIGIGTTTPSSLLSVASSTAAGTSILLSVGSSADVFTVLANGSVGIGTTTSSRKLDVIGSAAVNSLTIDSRTGSLNADLVLTGRNAGVANSVILSANFNGGLTAYPANGLIGLNLNPSSGATLQVSTSTTIGFPVNTLLPTGVALGVNGGVSIGTTTPSTSSLFIQGTSTNNLLTVASLSGATLFNIASSGNVGISSAAPPARLYLNQLSGGVTGGFLVGQGDSATNYAAALYRESSVNYGVLGLFDGNTTARVSLRGGVGIDSYFNSGGDLGIGTTTPTSLLTVASSTQSTSYSIFSVFNALATPVMNILGSGAVLFGTATTANCGTAPCGLTVATTTQFTAGTVARVVGYSSAASTTINLNTTDIATTTIDRATTFVNPTGTAYDGSMFEIRAKATTTQTVYWDTVFASSTDLTNVSSVASGTTRFLFEYRQDVGKWELVGKLGQYIN